MARIKKPKPHLGQHYIKAWREFRGLTQEQLGSRVDLSRTQLSRIENFEQPYSQPLLEALAHALMCEPADLIMRDPNSEVWSIMDTLRSVKPEDMPKVMEILEVFRKAS